MKKLALIFLLFTRTLLAQVSYDPALDNVVYPIKVLGSNETIRSARIHVSSITGVTGIYVEAHSISDTTHAFIRINNGVWYQINNENAHCIDDGDNWQCVNGVEDVIHFYMNLPILTVGYNKIDFRFTPDRGANALGFNSMGFRILKIDTWPRGGVTTKFIEDNPDNWVAPLPGATAIANGLTHFSTRNTLIDFPGGASIQAACSDCHGFEGANGSNRAELGYDLDYFAFSNESIIERSKFHGLTETQGKEIASYIRSLDSPRAGRPWNPPFQPGPGLDSKPEEFWTAGAGVGWVIDNDEDALAFLYPDGILRDTSNSTNSTLNLRELPMSAMSQDWNGWLPIVHPLDSWYNDTGIVTPGDEWEASDAWASFLGMPAHVSGGNYTNINNQLDRFYADIVDFRRTADNYKGSVSSKDFTQRQRDTQLWAAVQFWGFMRNIEDLPDVVYPDQEEENGELRGWSNSIRVIFDIAPHIASQINPPNCTSSGSVWDCYPYPTELQNKCASHIWYHMQMIMNPGFRAATSGISPEDWKYQWGHIGDCSGLTFTTAGTRVGATYIKNQQQHDGDRCLAASGAEPCIANNGWYLRDIHPQRIFRASDAMGTCVTGGGYPNAWCGFAPEVHRDMIEAGVRAHIRKNLEYAISDWPRGYNGQWEVEPADYVPVPWPGGSQAQFDIDSEFADGYIRVVQIGKTLGISDALLDSVNTWGKLMWPLGDWDTYNDPPTASVETRIPMNITTAEHPTNTAFTRATINFTTFSTQNVTVTVYDFEHRKTTYVFRGNLSSGAHSYTFDVLDSKLGWFVARVLTPNDTNYPQDRLID